MTNSINKRGIHNENDIWKSKVKKKHHIPVGFNSILSSLTFSLFAIFLMNIIFSLMISLSSLSFCLSQNVRAQNNGVNTFFSVTRMLQYFLRVKIIFSRFEIECALTPRDMSHVLSYHHNFK